MSSGSVIISNVFLQDSTKMLFSKRNHMIQAFPPDGTDHPFHERILPGRFPGDDDLFDSHSPHPLSEISSIDGIPITNQIFRNASIAREGFDDLLCGPFHRWMRCHVEMNDPSPVMGQDKEAEQQSIMNGEDQEEVTGGSMDHVVSQKGPPALGGWPLISFFHVFGNGGFRHIVTQQAQFRLNPRGSPKRVLSGNPADQMDDFQRHHWSPPSAGIGLPSPVVLESLPVPPDDGLGFHKENMSTPISPESGKKDPEDSIFPVKPGTFQVPLKDQDLLSKR